MLTNNVKVFIRESIQSVWGLELLLFLRRYSEESWTVAALTRELRASEFIVHECLGLFRAAHLIDVSADGTIKFSPSSPKLKSIIDEIANAYTHNAQALADEIYASDNRIRDFADAFRLKKES